MNKPKVSVCVPTYNQEKEIRDCLDGILAQKNCEFEIIIANDCSTDNTGKVCVEYCQKYPEIIRYINQPTNKGIINNTKDCILAAKGEYIAICEGDDYWIDSEKLSEQVSLLEKDDKVSMVHTKWTDYYTDTEQFKEIENLGKSLVCEDESGQNSFTAILTNQYRGIRFSSVLFRRSVLEKGLQFNTDFFSPKFTTIDIGIFYIMAYYGRLAYIDRSTTVYRLHDGSVSVNKNVYKASRFSLGVLYSNLYFCRQFKVPQHFIDKTFRRALQGLCPYILSCGDVRMSEEIVKLAREYNYRFRIGQSLCIFGSRHKSAGRIIKSILKI